MEKKILKDILLMQDKIRADGAVERELLKKIDEYKNTPFIIIVSGIRRCGKSTLLLEMKNDDFYYVNFDDERFVRFGISDFQLMYETLIELFGERDFFIFDEIQNITGWERFVRRLYDEGRKIYITGSNAKMLSRELGTHLTGRNINFHLYPFSFREFLDFKKELPISIKDLPPNKRALIKKSFTEYAKKGGFPEYLKYEKEDYLKSVYENIIYRDIISRYRLPSEKALKEVIYFAASNVGKEMSFNKIRKYVNLSSTTTVKEYFGYLENSYLAHLISRYSDSLKKQIYYNKKIYLIDTCMINILGFRLSEDYGRVLENIVFLELARKNKDIYFHKEKYECDFLVRDKNKIMQAIQVTRKLGENNREREINGLSEALKTYKLTEGLILTEDDKDMIRIGKYKILVKPIWEWLLENAQ